MKVKHRVRARLVMWVSIAALALLTILGNGAYWLYQERRVAALEEVSRAEAAIIDAELARIEAKKVEPVYMTLPGADIIEVLRDNYEDDESLWVLVNKERTVSLDYAPVDLEEPRVSISGALAGERRMVRTEAARALETMFAAAAEDGNNLMLGSAYRSAAYQESLFNGYVASSGYEQASRYSAQPGHSEHQLGLAVDISTASQQCFISACFTSTADGQWLAANAHKYGYILRYPEGDEEITGYGFEPWHYRYVGVDLATALHQSGLTLEEAWPSMEEALQTLKDNRAPEVSESPA